MIVPQPVAAVRLNELLGLVGSVVAPDIDAVGVPADLAHARNELAARCRQGLHGVADGC